MDKRNIFLYWVGKEYKLISILRNLIYLHSKNGNGYTVNLITDKNIKDYIKNIPNYFSNLCPANQADFIRVHIICDYGGIWLDSDTLIMDKLDTLFDIIEKKNGFFIKENNTILCNGVFGSKKNTPLMKEWRDKMMLLLKSKQGKIEWSEIGCTMLRNIYNSHPEFYNNYEIFNGLDNLYPINWNNGVVEFIKKPYDNYKNIIRKYQPLIILVNSVYKELENMTEEQILNGHLPLNYFLNKSFENAGISKNEFIIEKFNTNYVLPKNTKYYKRKYFTIYFLRIIAIILIFVIFNIYFINNKYC